MLGGLVARRARFVPATTRTTRGEFMDYLRKRSVWLEDVDAHPVVLGVPLGVTGSSGRTVAIDVGLKNPATISIRELVQVSPYFKQAAHEHALRPGRSELPPIDALIRSSPPIAMAVITKEDMQSLPIASPVRRACSDPPTAPTAAHACRAATASHACCALTSRPPPPPRSCTRTLSRGD